MKTEFQEEKLLRVRLLGPPEVSFEGQSLRFGRKKALALVCYLAAEGRKRSGRELAELLWPRSDLRSARTDLQPKPIADRHFEIEYLDSGVEAYCFTFG